MAISPEAQELLEGQSRNDKGQFVPRVDPALAPTAPPTTQPPPAAPEKPPGQMVPLAAVEGEQRAAAAKMQRVREGLPLGYQLLDDGTIVPPTQTVPEPSDYAPQPGQRTAKIDPELQEVADALGMDAALAEKLQRVVDRRVVQTGGTLLDPLSRHGFAQSRAQFAQDPDFAIYEKTFDAEVERRVAQVPVELRAAARVHPEFIADALAVSRSKHFSDLVQRAVERAAKGGGKVVGRFTEGPAPGAETPPAPELTQAQEQWITTSGIDLTPEQKANIAARRAARQGQSR